MIPYTSAVGNKYTYFISTHHKLIENDKIEVGMLLISSNDSLDPYDYHLSKIGLDCFKKLLECNKTHSSWTDMQSGGMLEIVEDEEDVEENVVEVVEEGVQIHELEFTDGSNEVVKILNQKCVICFERDSDYIFKQCGHQCFCEEGYQKKRDIVVLKCLVCRT